MEQAGSTNKTDYFGGRIYESGQLKEIAHEEGRILATTTGFEYHYYLRDHLGNVRVEFKEDANGEATITQENHYYPFGMRFSGEVFANNDNDFRYNGKELQDDFGLDWYDYGARFYDPILGRFTGIDPIADKFVYVTPYNYAENDPAGAIDLWGLQKVKVSWNVSLTSGKVGLSASALNIGLGGGFSKGAVSNTISVFMEIDMDKETISNLGVSHSKINIEKSSNGTLGLMYGGESVEKSITRELSFKDGAQKYTESEKKEYAGIGPFELEETSDGNGSGAKTPKINIYNLEVNAIMLGVESSLEIELDSEDGKNKKSNNDSEKDSPRQEKVKPLHFPAVKINKRNDVFYKF